MAGAGARVVAGSRAGDRRTEGQTDFFSWNNILDFIFVFQLCDTSSPDNDENNSQIYSAPVTELGSTTNLNQVAASEATAVVVNEKNGNNNACQASSSSASSAKHSGIFVQNSL